ncbi:DUF3413 domain-containing protein [Aliidiomarina sanyensis]|uniref:Alkaline phosphatase n=1 Tax=Aliidiomarina sanyensis TaxID=1249555 RepID=A0A432WRP1_9GAMM|nr:DUF3413 domain-containing protein [Aliidiomarina sanyensis]RUO36435.1 alkaline phosphatase [Aliidiomarina sanyensis]
MGKNQQRDRIARLVSWGHWFTFCNILLCLGIGLLYVETAIPAETALAAGYLIISWLGHFAFLPFVIFIVLLFPLCILLPFSRVLRGYAALVATVGIFALLFDVIFFRSYGFHLNTYSLAQLASDAEGLFPGGSFLMLALFIFAFLFIFGSQLVLANLTWKRLEHLQARKYPRAFVALFIASFLASHSSHIWADAVLYTPITQQDDLFPLSYPTTAKTLMARHGWITVERYQSQRDRLTGDETLTVRYPQAPLLCAREAGVGHTILIAFDQLDEASVQKLRSELSDLQRHGGTHLGHRQTHLGAFSVLYSIPDLYHESLTDQQLMPAYLNVLGDYSIPFTLHTTASLNDNLLPQYLRTIVHNADAPMTGTHGISVIFAASSDIDSVIDGLMPHMEQPNTRVLMTGLTAAETNHIDVTLSAPERIRVPLLYAGIELQNRELTHLDDLMPTVLSHFISCTDDFSAFSTGRNLKGDDRVFPRVQSIRPYIYLFEGHQLTVLDQEGELQLYNEQGQLVPGGLPATPVFIQALRDLQRFGNQVD